MLAVYADAPHPDDPLAGIVVGERPKPAVPDGWIRVQVRAASLNRHDLWTLRGVGIKPEQFPMIPTISPASKRRLTLSRAKSDPFAVLKVLLSPLISIIVSSYINIKAPIRRTRAYPCYHLCLFINHFINLIKYASDWFIL